MKFQQIKESLGQDADVMEQDHEVQMARADCFHAAKHAIELHQILKGISERQGLEGWVSEKITLAADYLRTVKEYLEYEEGRNQAVGFEKTDYDMVLDGYLGESLSPLNEKELSQKDIERRISTPNLSAKARELLLKAFAQFPQSKNEIDAIVNYLESVKNSGETNISRLDRENRDQDSSIDQLEQENTAEIQQIQRLEQELQKIKQRTLAKTQPSTGAVAPPPALEEMSAGATGVGAIAAAPAQNLFKKPTKRARK